MVETGSASLTRMWPGLIVEASAETYISHTTVIDSVLAIAKINYLATRTKGKIADAG